VQHAARSLSTTRRKSNNSHADEFFGKHNYVKRFAEKMGKQIHKIDQKTLELCQGYGWPGNIRELQNIVVRSVILSSGDSFWIDEAWLSISNQPCAIYRVR